MHKTTFNLRNQLMSIIILMSFISFGLTSAQPVEHDPDACEHTGTVYQFDSDVGPFQILLDDGQWIIPVVSSVPDFFSDGLRVRVGFEYIVIGISPFSDSIQHPSPDSLHFPFPCFNCQYVYLTCAIPLEPEPFCKARFEAFPLEVTDPDTEIAGKYIYEFIDVSKGNVIERVWFIDGDSIYAEEILTYEFHKPGYYTVCLTIVTDEGCHDQYCLELYVGGSSGDCYADFGYYPISDIIILDADSTDLLIMGYPYQFYDKSEGEVVDWTWTFGEDIIKGDSIPMYVFPFPGEYEVCLTITTSDNCTSTQCRTIVVGPAVECRAMFEYYNPLDDCFPGIDCPGSTVLQFVDRSKGEITNWHWDFGDGTHSREQNPIHEFPHTGEFVVCLTVSSPDGCEDTYCTVVHFDPWWDCNAYFEYCAYHIEEPTWNDVASLPIIGFKNLSKPDAIRSEWDFGDGTYSTEHNPLHVYNSPGVYHVCLSIYSSDGCYDTYCRRVYVGVEECKADFTHEIIVPNCWGYETAHYFSAITTEEPWSYFWDFGDGYYGYEEEVAHVYADEGYYEVCLEVTYANGCVASKCKSILNSVKENDSIYFGKCNPSASEFPQAEQALSVSKVYPVPASEFLYIDLYSESSNTIDISLINTLGQKTSLSENYSVSAGDNQLELHLGKLEPGTYIYVISSSDNIIRGRVSIIQ